MNKITDTISEIQTNAQATKEITDAIEKRVTENLSKINDTLIQTNAQTTKDITNTIEKKITQNLTQINDTLKKELFE